MRHYRDKKVVVSLLRFFVRRFTLLVLFRSIYG
jgi:hypothetical protein